MPRIFYCLTCFLYHFQMLDQGDLGPDKCPRIELPRADSPDAKILVPSGRREKISVMGVNLHDFQTVDVSCYFVSLSGELSPLPDIIGHLSCLPWLLL